MIVLSRRRVPAHPSEPVPSGPEGAGERPGAGPQLRPFSPAYPVSLTLGGLRSHLPCLQLQHGPRRWARETG